MFYFASRDSLTENARNHAHFGNNEKHAEVCIDIIAIISQAFDRNLRKFI